MAIFQVDLHGLAGFTGAKDDGSGGDNWSYKSCKVLVRSSQPINQLTTFYTVYVIFRFVWMWCFIVVGGKPFIRLLWCFYFFPEPTAAGCDSHRGQAARGRWLLDMLIFLWCCHVDVVVRVYGLKLRSRIFDSQSFHFRGTGSRGLMRGVATLPEITRIY